MFLIAGIAASISCTNNSLQSAANSVLYSIQNRKYECVHHIIVNPELKFPKGTIAPTVLESLSIPHIGQKSFYEIATSKDVSVVFDQRHGRNIALYMEKKYIREYLNHKDAFEKSYWMKRFFSCEFVKSGSSWRLSEDFCFTEQD